MATASAYVKPGFTWHSRAVWSARDDRLSFAVWLGLLWLGLLAGFGTDMSRFLHESPPAPRVVDLHAFAFTVWMFLLTAQVLLVTGNRVAWHKKLGWFTAAWACLMGALGPWAAIASHAVNPDNPLLTPPFLSIQFGDIVGFLFFVVWGIALRKNPAAHKRIMILSTVALIDAGYGRLAGWIWPAEPSSAFVWYLWNFYGNVLLLALIAAWDLWRGRLMKQFVLGSAILLAMETLETFLYFWAPWKEITTNWVNAWARHAA